MAFVRSLHDLHFATTNGYGIVIKAKVPTWVPDPALKFCIEKGCVQCDEQGVIRFDVDVQDVPEATGVPTMTDGDKDDKAKRAEAILAAVEYLVTAGKKEDFRADNTPKKAAIERLVGFKPTEDEVQSAMTAFQDKV